MMSVQKLSDRITIIEQGQDGWYVILRAVSPEETTKYAKRLILLNSTIPKDGLLAIDHISFESAKIIAQEFNKAGKQILSFIGHESTAKLLEQLLGIPVPYNRAMYQPQHGDLALVFRLKKRLEKPDDVKSIKPEDIEVLAVYYF